MLVTAFTLWLVATEGLQLTGWILVCTALIDFAAWGVLENVVGILATGQWKKYDWNEES